jgi:hypothetical protein
VAEHDTSGRRSCAAPLSNALENGSRPYSNPDRMAAALNGRSQVIALKALSETLNARRSALQRSSEVETSKPNQTGLPDNLKQGMEGLSGISLEDVRVHRNSSRPALLQAHAYAQGSDIHLAPGQDHHLPHEAWHVVQQKQGRVRPTVQLKAGISVNDDQQLEREADVMGAKALGSFPGRSHPLRAPTLSGSLPVQCQLWRWNAQASPARWETVGASSSTAVPPAHTGLFDGQTFDDTPYTQATDPTVTPFLRSGENYMGERGVDKQLSGKTPLARDIRVDAVKSSGLSRGSGLHEVVPTNLGGQVSNSGNEALIGAQSGFRTSTGQQLFNIGGGDVGAHTGFAPKPGSRGYTHTKGQAAAHDEMRDVVDDIVDNNVTDVDEVVNELALRHLEVSAQGQAVLNSAYITGMLPNYHQGLGAVGPVVTIGPPDPQRLRVAQDAHNSREAVKRRVRTHKRSTGRGRSPSPPRRPINAQGGGGDPITTPSLQEEVEALPLLPDSADEFEYAANLSAWLSQPQRF